MATKKQAKQQQQETQPKNSLSKIPEGMWLDDKLRRGIYKLYPGKSIEVEGVMLKNNTKEVVRLEQGKEIPPLG